MSDDMLELFIILFVILGFEISVNMSVSDISSEIRKIRKLLERKDDDK